jgi:putative membrane protein
MIQIPIDLSQTEKNTLTVVADSRRQINIVKNDYNEVGNPYGVTNPDALADGDNAGRGTGVFLDIFNDHLIEIPTVLLSVLGTCISLLLGFMVNQSYERWWEARKIWGSIVNNSRNLILQLQFFIPQTTLQTPALQAAIKKIAHRQIAFCYVLTHTLRRLPLPEYLSLFLEKTEQDCLSDMQNKPLTLIQNHILDIKELVEQGHLNTFQQINLDKMLTAITENIGKCERIKTTVFPVTYRIFVHYAIYIFLILLSVCLMETMGVWEIPIITLTASVFFLIEKAARLMQDPFNNIPTDTPMLAISQTIEMNLKQLIGESSSRVVPPNRKYYVM